MSHSAIPSSEVLVPKDGGVGHMELIDLKDVIDQGGSFWTNRAEAHGQLALSPTRLPEQLRSSR